MALPFTSVLRQDGAMALPSDADIVLAAVRLGWTVAEVRGRNRQDAPAGMGAKLPSREGHALPLQIERTPTELRIESQAVLIALATRLGVDLDRSDWSSFSGDVDSQATALAQARDTDGKDADKDWSLLTEEIYRFDAHIQDSLTAKSDSQACGYQLGRAMAESYWALDTTVADGTHSPAAWWFLLGPERCNEISRLLGRLSAYMHPYTATAITGSVEVWQRVAADPRWRAVSHQALYRQVRRWYELIILQQDPTTLVRPYALLRNFRGVWQGLRVFWPQLVETGIGAAALAGFAVLFGEQSMSSWLKTLLGFCAIAGFSAAGISAKLKNEAQALIKRLRQDVYTDLIAVAITTAPDAPGGGAGKASMTSTVQDRRLTPATPN
jgi:hypothetical protein